MKNVSVLAALLMMVGCASHEAALREMIRKDPKIVFDAIEEHPEEFLDVVNRAAQAVRKKQVERQADERQKQLDHDVKNPKQPELDPERRLAGSPTGKITVIEYADFQCPACGVAFEGLKKFKEKYKNDIQFYYKNMPLDFHPMAYPAASYYEALFRKDKIKAARFYDFVFEHQRELSDEFLKKAVRHVGANLDQIEKERTSEAVKKIIEDDMSEFHKFQFTGTPVVILNGVALNGAQRFEDLERVLKLTTR